MKLLEVAKKLVEDKEIQERSVDILSDSVAALYGSVDAAGKVILSLVECPFFLRDRIFWSKFELFLNGLEANDDERAVFCAKLAEDGKKGENAYRLIQIIDRTETLQKIDYLVNASRALGAGFIDLPFYFRICNTIMETLQEDLAFLSEHITKRGFPVGYGTTVQGLLNVGLMYQSKIDEHGYGVYKFTPFALDIDQYAVSFSNVDRYPSIETKKHGANPRIRYETNSSKYLFMKPLK